MFKKRRFQLVKAMRVNIDLDSGRLKKHMMFNIGRHKIAGMVKLRDRSTPTAESILVVCAHLMQEFYDKGSDEGIIRARELTLLRSVVESEMAQDPSMRVVLLGDFNINMKKSKEHRTIAPAAPRGPECLCQLW